MSTFFAGTQSVADRMRASREAIGPLLTEFRKHPQAQWQTMLAELSLALESEMTASSPEAQSPPARVPSTLARSEQATVTRTPALAKTPSAKARALPPPDSFTGQVLALLRSRASGYLPIDVGEAVYGARDHASTHKARAVVHHLVHKWGIPIERTADGTWVIRDNAHDERGYKEPTGDKGDAESVPVLVRRVLGLSGAPMTAGEILREVRRIRPDVSPGSLYDALSKGSRRGSLAQRGQKPNSTYALMKAGA